MLDEARAPWWWGWPPVHLSHQAALNRKEPSSYSFDATEYANWGYVWPSKIPSELRGQDPHPSEVAESI